MPKTLEIFNAEVLVRSFTTMALYDGDATLQHLILKVSNSTLGDFTPTTNDFLLKLLDSVALTEPLVNLSDKKYPEVLDGVQVGRLSRARAKTSK